MTAIFSLATAIVFALAGAIWGGITAVRKIRENATIAEQQREEAIQKRIKDALAVDDGILQRERDIAGQWKELALAREGRIADMVSHISSITRELVDLREKYNSLSQLYNSSQTKLMELERRLDAK